MTQVDREGRVSLSVPGHHDDLVTTTLRPAQRTARKNSRNGEKVNNHQVSTISKVTDLNTFCLENLNWISQEEPERPQHAPDSPGRSKVPVVL